MDKRHIILRGLIRACERYEKEQQGLYEWELHDLKEAKKWFKELEKENK